MSFHLTKITKSKLLNEENYQLRSQRGHSELVSESAGKPYIGKRKLVLFPFAQVQNDFP